MGRGDPGDARPLPGDVVATCAEAAERIAAYTGLQPGGPLPVPETVDRAAWAEANLASMAAILDPVAERLNAGGGPLGGVMRRVGGAVLGMEAGALAGFLGRKVLGQYDLKLLEDDPVAVGGPASAADVGGSGTPPRLLMVGPNIREAARDLDVDLARLTQWVAVHEVTHAVQFGAVPWLRPHLGALLRELLTMADVRIDPARLLRVPSREELAGVVDRLRSGNVIELVAGGERRATLDRVQAAMALVEGHAELVMDAVGAELLGDLSDLREALDRRRARERPALVVWLERLLGLEMKMRQYEQGRRFCDTVIERADVATLHRAFEDPELLPDLAELVDPDAWLRRTANPRSTV